MEIKPLPRSENCQRRTRNSNSENATDENNEIMMTPRKNSGHRSSIKMTANSNCNSISGSGSKHKVKSGKSMARPLLGFKIHSSASSSLSTSCLNATRSSFRRTWCPLVLNALIFILFTNAINFGNCAVNSAANSDSLINQPQHTTFDDTTTTTSSTKFNTYNNNNNNNYNNNNNKNSNKLNDTQNLLLPQLANQQKSITYRQVNPLIITGFRLESSTHEVEYDNGIPSVMSETPFTIRIFGKGITEDTLIAFTNEPNEAGTHCQFPATLLYKIVPGTANENTALYEGSLPKSKKDFYLCAKIDPNEFMEGPKGEPITLQYQCTDSWCIIRSHESFLPLWVSIIIILVCLCFSALFSGLNLGLMALDRTELKILRNTGSDKEREYAKKIQPAICSRHGLAVGAKTILITKMIMIITFPLSYPTSKILDVLLGEEIGNVYNRERLKELVKVTTGINDLDKNEVNIISGALELRKKTVADVMTHIDDAFMLPLDATLDFETVSEIMKSGFSRIPVYEGDRKNIVTLLYIKDLAFVDPDDNTPLRTLCEFYQNPVHFVFEDYTLDVMFNQFKDGTIGHLAFVHRVNNEGDGDPFYETIGLVTLEDVIEELIQAEIVDETDVFVDNRTKVKRNRNKKQDFTVFAERRENQTIHISPQLTLATYQYLTIDAFKKEVISEQILRRLLNQDIVHSIKCKGKEKDDPSLFIFTQGKPVDFFVLILEGRVEVTVGKESLLFESGPFTYFGTQALIPNVVVDSPSQMGSLQSLNLDSKTRQTFIPDYSVRAVCDLVYIAIKRSLYLTAKKATLLEKTRKAGTEPNSVDIDDEVEKLLHSLHDDERPNHIRGSQSIRKTSTVVGSNTASPSFNDFSQQSRSIAAATTQHNSQGSNNDVVSLSSLMTSEAAAIDYNTIEHNNDRQNNGEKVNNNDVVTTPLLPKTDLKHNNTNSK
ncbi:Metal transporter CNNM2 [Lucilia cuprina]|nr:Metal transporter CNNM2 [Lucilia cuprina]